MDYEENHKSKLERLKGTHARLQQEWNKRSEKTRLLRLDLAATARAADKFELEHQIQNEEANLRILQEDIENIETEMLIITEDLKKSSVVYEYRITGPLPANAPTYVERKADKELFDKLMASEFCYVFNSRQMGKSSLRVKTKALLEKKGFVCINVLPTMIVSNDMTEDQWYRGIINTIVMDLGLGRQFNDNKWWTDREGLSGVQRFSNFIREELLQRISQKIVIFIDEIDRILSLRFNLDSFFAAIRECYNNRVENPEYNRLTFALLGVATPSDLIRDGFSTPFNIGHAIDLTGFTFQEALPLVKGLEKTINPQAVLKAILSWTNGQPFLTQKLFILAQINEDYIPDGNEVDWIKSLVEKHITKNRESQDVLVHLKAIDDRFRGDLRIKRLLEIYGKILKNDSIEADSSPEQIELRLSGLVVKQGNQLKIYNPIYKKFFNQRWLIASLRNVAIRPYADQIDSWKASGCQDQSKLLFGEALKKALKWSEGVLLSKEDNRFLFESRELDQQIQLFLDLKIQGSIIEIVMLWTGGQKELNESIFLLLSRERRLYKDSAKSLVERVIRTRMIEKWQTEPVAEPLRKIRVKLLKSSICDPFWLLMSYRKLFLPEEIELEMKKEQEELIKMGIVIERDGKLNVANHIYESVFNLIWINQNLGQLRPYAKKIVAWIDSNCQDKSCLLSAKEFDIAQEWAVGKNLEERENRFLIDSIIWNT